MGNVINLKEAVTDYKPGQTSAKMRLHALEVLLYIEGIEADLVKPEVVTNNIIPGDLAIINQQLI